MKDEGWRLRGFWWWTDRWTDICDFRVSFATEKWSLHGCKCYSRGDQFFRCACKCQHYLIYIYSFMKLISDVSWKLCYSGERTSCGSSWRQRFDELWPTAGDKQWKEPASVWFDHHLFTVTDNFSSLQKCYASEIEQIWNFADTVSHLNLFSNIDSI